MSQTLPPPMPATLLIKTGGQQPVRKQIAEDERLIAGYSLESCDDCPLCKKYRARGYNAATLAAMKEGQLLANDPHAKTYTVDELFAELSAGGIWTN